MTAIIRCDIVSGHIFAIYNNIKDMADIEKISLATAYYKASKRATPMNGQKFMFENDYIKQFPDSEYAKNKEAVKEKMVMLKPAMTMVKPAMTKEETCDNEMELLNKPVGEAATKKPGRKKKEEPEQKPPKTKPVADLVNHPPHYCTGDIECWDAMMSAFGAEWMMAYANVAAFKYSWRAKHKGKFAEDMRKAAWYNERAAELKERIDAERREGTEG